MAEKDITEKILMSHADVFADCINTLVYDGKQRLNMENTQSAPTESFYKGVKSHNQFCDTSRYLVEEGNIIAQYIIENETQPKERQILRKFPIREVPTGSSWKATSLHTRWLPL